MALTRLLHATARSTVLCQVPPDYASHHRHFQHRRYTSYTGSYYDILELTPHASQTQIKSAYYRLSKKYHPDVAGDVYDAKEKFARLSTAYEVLGNPRTRRMYDNGILRGDSGTSSSSPSEDTDVEYHEFLRRRGTFRARNSGPVHTGRSPMFDFDEFYRQHYGDSIKTSQESRRNKANVDEELAWQNFAQKRNAFVYASAVVISVLSILLTGRFRKF